METNKVSFFDITIRHEIGEDKNLYTCVCVQVGDHAYANFIVNKFEGRMRITEQQVVDCLRGLADCIEKEETQ